MSARRFGILIASSRFPEEPKLEDLRFPESDVDGLNELLVSPNHGQFTQTFVLKNKLHHEILLKINQILRDADRNDLVLIYYSGHGKLNPAGRLHLTSTDTVINALEATSISVSTIKDYVDISSSNKIVLILDCCFSGAAGEAFARSGVDDQLQLVSGGRGTYILTASTGIQVAQEKESDQYGVFTKHLIEGIKSGEADLDSDGRITMGDLYRYVHDKVLDEGFQEPMKWDLNVRGELVIARSGKTPREERRKQIRAILFDLAKKGFLPDDILDKARQVIALAPDQHSEEDRTYDRLLDQLLKKRLEPGEFIRKWDKVRPGKPDLQTQKQEELKRKAEEEKRRKEEKDLKQKSEGERRRTEAEAKRKAEEERKKKEIEARHKVEEERKRKEEEQRSEAERKGDEEERRIDAVAPSNASVGQSMNVFVQVRFPDSDYLSIKDWPFKNRPSLIEQASKSTKVRFSKNFKGELAPTYLKFKVVAPEFKVEGEPEKIVEIHSKQFSELISFQLIPKFTGVHGIMVNVCDENGVSVGELPVETDVYGQEKPSVNEATIVVLALNVLVNLEPAKVLEQAGYLDETIITPKPSELKPNSSAPSEPKLTEPIASKPRKASNALIFGAVAGIIVLLMTGGWLYYKYQQEKETRIKIESFYRQIDGLEIAVAEIDKPEQIEELYRQRDTLSHQVEGFSEQAAQAGLVLEMEELQERLKQFQIQLANKEKEFFPTQRTKIFVAAVPDNAMVKILNLDQRFQQGMELVPGKYHVAVSSEGYEPQDRWIEIGPEEEKQINFELKKIMPSFAWLHVEAFPEGAKIRILNIIPKFFQGMELEPGRYHVEIAAEGYETQRRWIDLVAGHEEPFRFELAKIKTPSPPSPQEVITNSIGMKFTPIPAGKFVMGSQISPEEVARRYGNKVEFYKDEQPPHTVYITKPFYLQTTEVSQAQWKRVMGNNRSKFKDCGDDCPVEQVSWDDAQEFISKLNRREGKNKYRLPTEAEWEYACRAGTETAYSFDKMDKLDKYAWYWKNSGKQTHPVGKKKPNAYGLYDMHGNVWEWCQDLYGDYPSSSVADPKGPTESMHNVLRGGSSATSAASVRSADRGFDFAYSRSNDHGFRVAQDF